MAKRKLLNSEREIILSKTLQHVFKDALLKLDAEYKVVNNNFISWYKQFIQILSNLEYEKCLELANKNLITKCTNTALNGVLLIKDAYFSSYKNDRERIAFYFIIGSIIRNVWNNKKTNIELDFLRYTQYTGNHAEPVEQRYA